VALTDRSGYTAKLGLEAKYHPTQSFVVDFYARCRYLSRLTDHDGAGFNIAEMVLSFCYRCFFD
jgi:hypothetical protein